MPLKRWTQAWSSRADGTSHLPESARSASRARALSGSDSGGPEVDGPEPVGGGVGRGDSVFVGRFAWGRSVGPCFGLVVVLVSVFVLVSLA